MHKSLSLITWGPQLTCSSHPLFPFLMRLHPQTRLRPLLHNHSTPSEAPPPTQLQECSGDTVNIIWLLCFQLYMKGKMPSIHVTRNMSARKCLLLLIMWLSTTAKIKTCTFFLLILSLWWLQNYSSPKSLIMTTVWFSYSFQEKISVDWGQLTVLSSRGRT